MTTSGTGPGAARIEALARSAHDASCPASGYHDACFNWFWDDMPPEVRRGFVAFARHVANDVLADHAADPGARRERVAEAVNLLREELSVRDVLEHPWAFGANPGIIVHWSTIQALLALAAPDDDGGTHG